VGIYYIKRLHLLAIRNAVAPSEGKSLGQDGQQISFRGRLGRFASAELVWTQCKASTLMPDAGVGTARTIPGPHPIRQWAAENRTVRIRVAYMYVEVKKAYMYVEVKKQVGLGHLSQVALLALGAR
jgi:hypothetical protein